MKDKLLRIMNQFETGLYTLDEGEFEIKHVIKVNGQEFDLEKLGECEIEKLLSKPRVLIDKSNLVKIVKSLNKITKLDGVCFSFDSSDVKFNRVNSVWPISNNTYYRNLEFMVKDNQLKAEFSFFKYSFDLRKTVMIPIPTYLHLLG